MFQFPLHRDPRCNSVAKGPMNTDFPFQFPLHRDPRCNLASQTGGLGGTVSVPFTSGSSLQLIHRPHIHLETSVSVPFTSGSSLQRNEGDLVLDPFMFQFPLHRDPRCN